MASTNNSSNSLDVTKSLDQLCAQLSINHIAVPRVDAYKDIFEFVNEFETVSATLSDEQQLKLLIKAFPPGRLRTWYDNELKPLIDANSTWLTVKAKIIDRYSDAEDRDRHFAKLQGMRYKENSNEKLFDFVEELLFVFVRAFTKVDDDTKIRYVKSVIPANISHVLNQNNDFVSPRSLNEFLKAIRRYDKSRANGSMSSSEADKVKTSELITLIKELVKQETSKNNKIVAAVQPNSRGNSYERNSDRRPNSPRWTQSDGSRGRELQTFRGNRGYSPSNGYQQRYVSPRRDIVDGDSRYGQRNDYRYQSRENDYDRSRRGNYEANRPTRSGSPYPNRGRTSPSPNWRNRNPNYLQNNREADSQLQGSRDQSGASSSQTSAFSDTHYYSKHGKPPSPCTNCQSMHWIRHCPDNLN